MSVLVILKPGSFTEKPKQAPHGTLAGYGVTVFEEGRPYIHMQDEVLTSRNVPPEVTAAAVSYGYLRTFPTSEGRIRGEYRFKRATARIDWDYFKDGVRLELRIESPDFDDLAELQSLIRSGKIYPVRSFEDPQVKAPIRQIGTILGELGFSIQLAIKNWWLNQTRRA